MRKRAAATSRLVLPSATSRAIRRSASVSSPRAGRTPADARQLGARLLGPERRAEPFEAGERVLERRAGGAALLRAPLRPAEGEQRPRVVERIRAARVLGERALEAREGAREIAPRGEQQRAAAGEDGECPGPVERARACLPGREDLVGLVELADGDQRLEQVAELQALCRLEHEGVAKLVRASQVRERRRGVSERELDEAEHPAVARLRDADALGFGAGDCALRPGARLVDPAAVRSDDGSGKLVRRNHAAELRPEVQRVGRVAVRLLPVRLPATRAGSGTTAPPPLPRGRSAPSRHCRTSWKSVPRAVDVRRPAELPCRRPTSDRRRAATRPAIARARAPRPSPRIGMPRPVLKCMQAVGRECAAAERSVADTRGGADGELSVLDAALDPLGQAHQSGEAEVDGGLERIVALGFRRVPRGRARRRRAGLPGRRPDAQATVARSTPGAAAARAVLEQGGRPAGVSRAVVHARRDEQAPSGVIRTSRRA